jgi:hypothetical protein
MNAPCPLCASTDHEVLFDLRSVTNPLAVPGTSVRCRRLGRPFGRVFRMLAVATKVAR